ncbi:recombination protein RecR [Candidatus Kaiserbacteria bacterium CG10_big_fil_rev_8_21_14_0_10_45_20]|uniref:Recombination protein RecR n=1 Tax=Candidatus Kaiserbacteria bacterium CG10_big_fil_rev_8_21_14_0_10_45_20 TaxID=1974607 RepID=A0A2H0UGH1_9BACT|nr:MAG: recombination protein RecR [Candidatus Kaiserbacteria bacterium CG10_big_fil_rev_8_21_14_0_10_45_20]
MPRSLQKLVDLISELPGIGPRQARRVVQFLLRTDMAFKKRLAEAIVTMNENISQCSSCFRFDEVNAKGTCSLCANPNRDDAVLVVVEKDVDVDGVEAVHSYKGQYFVLGALMPLARQRKNVLSPRVNELIKRLKAQQHIQEVILAFSTTPEGDFTAKELKNKIQESFPTTKVTVLGRGLSLGAEIEYADQETLRSALQGRSEIF